MSTPAPGLAGFAYNGANQASQVNYRVRRLERGNVVQRRGVPVSSQSGMQTLSLTGKVAAGVLTSSSGINPQSSGFVQQGSVSASIPYPDFTFTANSPTQLIISWPAYAIRRADGTSVTIPAGRVQVDGLVMSTKYFFHPYWTDAAGAIGWVAGGDGTPGIAFTVIEDTQLQPQILASVVGLGVPFFTMPASGSSGGSTGGSGGDGSGDGGRQPSFL